MSIVITQPPKAGGVTVKKFIFSTKQRNGSYNPDANAIPGYRNDDTVAVNTTSASFVTLKSYNITVSSPCNGIRVKVLGYSSLVTTTAYYQVLLDGGVVASGSTTSTSAVKVIDYIANILTGSHTIEVQAHSDGVATAYITEVLVVVGILVNYTSLTQVFSISLVGTYTLVVNGQFLYKLGIYVHLSGSLLTTTNITITTNMPNQIQTATGTVSGDVDTSLGSWIGDYVDPFVINAQVGASGDAFIIYNIQVQATLLARFSDPWNRYPNYVFVRVQEKGTVIINGDYVYPDSSTDLDVEIYKTIEKPARGSSVFIVNHGSLLIDDYQRFNVVTNNEFGDFEDPYHEVIIMLSHSFRSPSNANYFVWNFLAITVISG
jgi:hypothetical protein